MITGVIVFTTSTLVILLYKDQIIAQVVREMNKSLLTKIDVGHIDLDLWGSFPKLNLVLSNVKVSESVENPEVLGEFQLIHLGFNVIDLIDKNFEFQNIKLINGYVDLKILENGSPNYQVIQASPETEATDFSFNRVTLDSIEIRFRDFRKSTDLRLLSSNIKGTFQFDSTYQIELNGSLYSEYIMLSETRYIENKPLKINGGFIYSPIEKELHFKKMDLSIEDSEFEILGNYYLNESWVDLEIISKNTTLNSLLVILNDKSVTSKIRQYKGEGNIDFGASLKGPLSRNKMPSFKGTVSLREGVIMYPNVKPELTSISLEGTFEIPDLLTGVEGKFQVSQFNAVFEEKTISGKFTLENFVKPKFNLDISGEAELKAILDLYPIKKIEYGSGNLDFDITYSGNYSNPDNSQLTGEIELDSVNIKIQDQLLLNNLSGNLLFNNHDIALNHVTGYLGNSDFQLNGFFKNIFGYLNQDNSMIGIEADLKSNFVDLDQLLLSDNETIDSYSFIISPSLFLNFNCDIRALHFRRLRARNLVGQIKLKDQLALVNDISGNAMGGEIRLNGLVNSQTEKIEVNSHTIFNNINIDSLFYVFENFNQNWLIDKNLKGEIYAEWGAEMTFDRQLTLFKNDLVSDISISITNGELNDFEPIIGLSKYVNDENLAYLKFSDLKNEIHIEKSNVLIPDMKVSSNITDISFSGIHSFDQKINYRVVVPFRVKNSKDKDEFFGAVESDKDGQTRLFLKIIGTTSDYSINYDSQAVKNKIAADLKNEIEELKNAFRKRGEKKKESLGLNEEEYFDWDEEK